MKGRDGPEKVGDLVESLLEKKGLKRQVARMEVLDRWGEIVGEGLAGVTRPRNVSGGTLFVEVRSSAWLMELNMMKDRILERINEDRAEDVRLERVVFVMGEGA